MEALGMVEVVGLVAGIEAADVACKSANVELVGYELAKGGGYVTIKVLGQVGAVTAAVDAAAQAAGKLTRVVSKLVIPRPNTQVEPMVHSKATVGYAPAPTRAAAPKAAAVRKTTPAKKAVQAEAAATRAAQPTPENPAGPRTPARETAEAPAEALATPAKSNPERK